MGELYRLTFSNSKSYIGLTFDSSSKRLKQHRANSKKSNLPVYKAWRKHGDPKLDLLAIIQNDDLPNAEIKAISVFNTMIPHGYNVAFGGSISPMKNLDVVRRQQKSREGYVTSEESKKKISDSLKIAYANGLPPPTKGIPLSDEAKRKISLSNSGRTSPRKGVKLTDEQKAKMSASAKLRAKRTPKEHYVSAGKKGAESRWKQIPN